MKAMQLFVRLIAIAIAIVISQVFSGRTATISVLAVAVLMCYICASAATYKEVQLAIPLGRRSILAFLLLACLSLAVSHMHSADALTRVAASGGLIIVVDVLWSLMASRCPDVELHHEQQRP